MNIESQLFKFSPPLRKRLTFSSERLLLYCNNVQQKQANIKGNLIYFIKFPSKCSNILFKIIVIYIVDSINAMKFAMNAIIIHQAHNNRFLLLFCLYL